MLIAETLLSPSTYKDLAVRSAFYDRVLRRVRALPSVTGAGYVNYPPLTFKGGRAYFSIEGQPPPPPADSSRNLAVDRVISGGYLAALGVPLVRGRHLDERDRDGTPLTVVVNERFVARHWPDRDPIGRRIHFGAGGAAAPWMTVVGVVGDVRQLALDAPAEPEVYLPAAQVGVDASFFWPQHLVVRSSGNPAALAGSIRRAVAEVDPDEPVANIRSMNDVFDSELLNRNTQMTLVAVFAGLALAMASIGLYGVLAYTVAQRVPEIGVRMALGADRDGVARLIVRQGGLVALAGIALGPRRRVRRRPAHRVAALRRQRARPGRLRGSDRHLDERGAPRLLAAGSPCRVGRSPCRASRGVRHVMISWLHRLGGVFGKRQRDRELPTRSTHTCGRTSTTTCAPA